MLGMALAAQGLMAQGDPATPIVSAAEANEITDAPESIWDSGALSGNWGGARSELLEKGYEFAFEYTAEGFSNVSGGLKTGSVYNGLGYGAVDVNGETALGVEGLSLRVSTLWTHGVSPGQYAGDELTVSNIDAYDGLRLYEVFAEKSFGQLNVRMGNLLADEEFVEAKYGGPLINAAFGQPTFWAANTLNTGPAFNVPGLGLRFRYDFDEARYAQFGIYDGDTFDDAGGDATINQHGTHFELGNGQGWTSLYEVGYNGFNVDDGAELPGWYRLGAWYHSSEFDTNAGGKKEGNGGIYGAVDKMLTRDGLGAFARLGISERDRSRFHWVLDTGFNYTGLIPGRDEDVTALGFVYGKHSSDITTNKSHEAVVELTHQFQVSPSVYLQPDIQWINRPSGDTSIDDALVIGLRAGFTF